MWSLSTQNLEQSSLQAYTPDQLLPYVQAVSEVNSFLLGDYIVHMSAGHAVLVGYALSHAHHTEQLDEVVEFLQNMREIQSITVLAPRLASCIPSHAVTTEDAYYFLDLPLSLTKQKNVSYMCQKAKKYVHIRKTFGTNKQEYSQDSKQKTFWTQAHQELVLSYIQRPDVSTAMGAIFQRLERYCQEPNVCLFNAYDNVSGELQGFCVGDYSSWQTALYMFAFRTQAAVPGVADVLLLALIEEAYERGYARCNLGLGINDGIRFFKEKWGARPSLPMFESTWQKQEQEQANSTKSWWSRLVVR